MTAPRGDAAGRPASPASLETLHARADAHARAIATDQRVPGAQGADEAAWTAHAVVLDRLAANRRHAEAHGWTSCAIERVSSGGRFELFGVPPGSALRAPVPEPAAEDRDVAWRALRRAAAACAAAFAPRGGQDGDRRAPSTPQGSAARDQTRERLPRAGERAGWRAQDAARDAAHTVLLTAVSVYTRALRVEGCSARRAAGAVALAVHAGAGSASSTLDTASLARLVHDAGCRSVEAYYTR
ncbi:hypothetical protein [Roseisolibacter sp. H3M3-2]|uniref:hypothetical protein n=1 Tax=Roseisolibacter sp. H3M3-2 TaxID=3031323 RepID=UPI0023D9EBD9|nr:hypothetical protein [Roseisolibacter sp. H3M3-2]MDF1501369.1 hypothetical protein [Roseisolibacter sp. H3M3-2]